MTEYEGLDAQLRAWLAEDAAIAREASGFTVVGTPGNWTPAPGGDEWEARESEDGDQEVLVALRPGLPRPPDVMGGYWGQVVAGSERYDDDDPSAMPYFRHIARHDPAAVLADIAGKIALLDHVAAWPHEYVDGDTWFSCSQAINPHDEDEEPGSGCADEKRAGKPCDCHLDDRRIAVLRCVAAGYVDRPGFKDAWRLDV